MVFRTARVPRAHDHERDARNPDDHETQPKIGCRLLVGTAGSLSMSLVVREIHASSYRSLRSIRFPTGRLTVFVGPNGVGKTNLYRVLQLLQAAAGGTLSRELAAEGGMQSAVWAGRRRAGPVRIVLSAAFGESDASESVNYSYEVAAGLPPPPPVPPDAFRLEPQIKEEALLFQHRGRTTKLL